MSKDEFNAAIITVAATTQMIEYFKHFELYKVAMARAAFKLEMKYNINKSVFEIGDRNIDSRQQKIKY